MNDANKYDWANLDYDPDAELAKIDSAHINAIAQAKLTGSPDPDAELLTLRKRVEDMLDVIEVLSRFTAEVSGDGIELGDDEVAVAVKNANQLLAQYRPDNDPGYDDPRYR
jgi:hypothetical protein